DPQNLIKVFAIKGVEVYLKIESNNLLNLLESEPAEVSFRIRPNNPLDILFKYRRKKIFLKKFYWDKDAVIIIVILSLWKRNSRKLIDETISYIKDILIAPEPEIN
ncbi:MAG: hypothetical protein ACFFDN_36225, partial [Candidatus Hodarchaeota archaeon]